MILRHAPRYPESMVRLRGIYPSHPAELIPKSVEHPAETAPKREYDLRGHKWAIPWAASRKIIMLSSRDMPVGPVLFEKGRGGQSKTRIFRISQVFHVTEKICSGKYIFSRKRPLFEKLSFLKNLLKKHLLKSHVLKNRVLIKLFMEKVSY